MRSELIQQQTNIEPHYREWIIDFAKKNDILLQDIWIRAINNLLQRRLKWAGNRGIPRYTARTRGYVIPWSVKLPGKLVKRVTAAAEEDEASIRTFYYTALLDFVSDHSENAK